VRLPEVDTTTGGAMLARAPPDARRTHRQRSVNGRCARLVPEALPGPSLRASIRWD
jgi:hypothetical protein